MEERTKLQVSFKDAVIEPYKFYFKNFNKIIIPYILPFVLMFVGILIAIAPTIVAQNLNNITSFMQIIPIFIFLFCGMFLIFWSFWRTLLINISIIRYVYAKLIYGIKLNIDEEIKKVSLRGKQYVGILTLHTLIILIPTIISLVLSRVFMSNPNTINATTLIIVGICFVASLVIIFRFSIIYAYLYNSFAVNESLKTSEHFKFVEKLVGKNVGKSFCFMFLTNFAIGIFEVIPIIGAFIALILQPVLTIALTIWYIKLTQNAGLKPAKI